MPSPEASSGDRDFDVCHVGVVLRALLAVHALIAMGVALAANGIEHWMGMMSAGSVVGFVGVLCWLLTVCSTQKITQGWPYPWRFALYSVVGGLCAVLGWLLLSLASLELGLGPRALVMAAAGTMMAAVLQTWLHLRVRLSEPAEAQARLAELQARIRPHFLFNTLNTVMALLRVDARRAEAVLEDLAELFRVALQDDSKAASLGEEIELAQRYLAIEQLRFGQRLRLHWDLAEGAAGARVPLLFLQPLVENAVRHGVEPNDAGADVLVRTRVNAGTVQLTVQNSVAGQASQPGNGMALRNVRERLHLMHDLAMHFEIRQDDQQFLVEIKIPL